MLGKTLMSISYLVICLVSTSPGTFTTGHQAKVWTYAATTNMDSLPRIVVSGNLLLNTEGDTVVFRGYNTSDPDKLARQRHWDRAYFEAIKTWGANVVRFPIHPQAWRQRGEEQYLELLDQGIQWATDLGMYVILDWHSIGNLKSGLFQNPSYRTDLTETLRFWRTMAQRYGNHTTVAFYELYNEPTVHQGRHGTCSWSEWKGMMEEMITIVRANGGQGIPLVAGFNWAYDLTPVRTDPIHAEGIAYVSHPYPQKRPKPWTDQWTADWGFVSDTYPLLLTEIGFAGAEERGAHIPVISDESYGDAITSYCDARGISYVVWVFDPNWAPSLFSDWDYTPTRHGRYFRNHMQSYTE